MRLALALLLLASCGSPVASRKGVFGFGEPQPHFCVEARYEADGELYVAKSCFPTVKHCETARTKMQSMGHLAGIKEVSECAFDL